MLKESLAKTRNSGSKALEPVTSWSLGLTKLSMTTPTESANVNTSQLHVMAGASPTKAMGPRFAGMSVARYVSLSPYETILVLHSPMAKERYCEAAP